VNTQPCKLVPFHVSFMTSFGLKGPELNRDTSIF
ncbi:hypothetical protein GGR01_003504, partial [Acetobacter oeni]|nr:hypothetical protein [Acetobacter oeni]